MSIGQYQLTPAQQAISEARKARKQKQAQATQLGLQANRPGCIIDRVWIPTQRALDIQQGAQRVKVLTWNLLAQCLIREFLVQGSASTLFVQSVTQGRDLFPTSNCLKAGQREDMIYHELLANDADVLCLQEVDRLENLLPVLDNAGYSYHYRAGPGKKHGCLLAFKANMYTMVKHRLVEYDNEQIRSDGDDRARRGRSFQTRNIGSFISLKSNLKQGEGIIVATTHLFWHPKYTYERTRQVGLLVREVARFRSELEFDSWPCIIGGDFNFAPDDPAYSLLVGDPLLPEQEKLLSDSRVVHVTVDPTVHEMSIPLAEEAPDSAADPDKVITNARPAIFEDGIFSVAELVDFFSRVPRLRSAYDEGMGEIKDRDVSAFGDRVALSTTRHGRNEPEYTSYTHYWKTVLDYIFVLDPIDRRSCIVGLLSPHRPANLEPGLPQKGVCGSDHVSLATELLWTESS